MRDNKHIDRFFQEKFKDFEVAPQPEVWQRIETHLDKKQKKRVIPFWWQWGGIAAGLAIVLTIGIIKWNAPLTVNPSENGVTRSADNPTLESAPSNSTNDDALDKWMEQSNQVIDLPEEKSNNSTKNIAIINAVSKTKSSSIEYHQQINDTNIILEKNQITTYDKHLSNKIEEVPPSEKTSDKHLKSIEEAIAEQEAIRDESNKPITTAKKWSLNPQVAPVYYSSVSNGSPIDTRFVENTKNGQVNISFGVNISYNVSDKLSVRSGLNKINLGYTTENVTFGNGLSTQAINTINFKNNASMVPLSNDSNINSLSPSLSEYKTVSTTSGSLLQNIGYLELPVEMKYRVTGNKLSMNLIGGFSTLFLMDNQILLTNQGMQSELGEANNLNDINFSTNIGIGVDYQFSKNMKLLVEPLFKYQLNTFSGDQGNFRPYSLGLHTGLSIQF